MRVSAGCRPALIRRSRDAATIPPVGGHYGRVRVLIAPDCFTGTLTAPQAAAAIAAGWARQAPGDELVLCPLADGGPGFVDVLAAAAVAPARSIDVPVSGPLGRPAVGTVLLLGGTDGAAPTAYVESAQACGLHLVPEGSRDPGRGAAKKGAVSVLRLFAESPT